MELRQIRTFLSIAKLGSFVRAAETLGYAQSTITNQIQILERELGVKLFDRLGHRVMLTDKGKSFLPFAEQMLSIEQEALKLAADPCELAGRLTIGTSESLGTYRLPGLLHTYRRECPKVEMVLRFTGCSEIFKSIRENEIDVALVINSIVKDEALISQIFTREEMLFLVSPDHSLAKKEQVFPEDLSETCVILTEPGCCYRMTIESIMRDHWVFPQTILEASSVESIKQMISLGLGVSMLPRCAVENELSEGKIKALKWKGPEPEYFVQMICHKDKWISPPLKEFIRLARKYLME